MNDLIIIVLFFFLVNVGDDSPVFEGLFEYCGLSAGGSMGNMNDNRVEVKCIDSS